MLVGGGELHETWESLAQTERPLQRGIQRFTGITQAMVDTRRRPPRSCRSSRSCWRARCWWPTTLASTAACFATHSSARASSGPIRRWSARCRWRGASRHWCAAAGSPRWPTHWGSRSTRSTAPSRRAHVRACLLRAVPQAVRQRADRRRRARSARPAAAVALARGDRGAPPPARGPARPVQAAGGPGCLHLPRRARAPAVRGQVDLAALAGTVALLRARGLDREGRDRRLPAHQLRAGRAGAGEPADQAVAAAGQPSSSAATATSTCAAAWSRPTRCSRWPASPRRGARSTSGR